ncbi:MAG: acyltransferase [Pirellula sp.]
MRHIVFLPAFVVQTPERSSSMLLRPENRILTSQSVWNPQSHCLELDGVRGLAILMVTIYRIFKELPSSDGTLAHGLKWFTLVGERGVDLFFVLSGFLITSILVATRAQPHYFRNFIARRALRIFPLYFFSLALFLWVIPTLVGTSLFDLSRTNQFYLWSYSSNVHMSWSNTWCFGPLDHFWSLAVEEHFYLVWPAIVFVLPLRWLFKFCLLTIVAVGGLRAIASTRPELAVAVDVLTVFRCDALCFGGLLAVWLNSQRESYSQLHQRKNAQIFRWGIVACGLLIPIAIAMTWTGKRWLTIPSSLYPAIWMLLMGYLLTGDRLSRMAMSARSTWMRWLGKYSYGMYVFQLPLLTLVPFQVFGLENSNWMLPMFAIYAVGMFSLVAMLAWLSFHTIEHRFLKLKKFFAD